MAFIIEIKYTEAGCRPSYIRVDGDSYVHQDTKTWATRFGSKEAAEAFIRTMPVYSFCNAIVRQVQK